MSDQRQVFNLSAVLQTPKFSSRGLRLIAGNWQISPIMKIKSGTYFTVTGGVDYALNGSPNSNSQRPNQVLANPYAEKKTIDHWLNPAAFAPPAPGTNGNLGANNMLGPGMFQLDLALIANVHHRGRKDDSVASRSLQSSESHESEQSGVCQRNMLNP